MAVTHLLTFIFAAVLITATPGPDNLMVLSMGISKGRAPGVAFGLGCAAGCLFHTVLAVLGVSAVIAASPLAFTALKWIGGAYLVWLGINTLRASGRLRAPLEQGIVDATVGQIFLKGMLANAINPKVVLFFLSFLPQFIVPGHGEVAFQLGLLGGLFAAQAAVLFTAMACFAGAIGGWLARTPTRSALLDRIAAFVFVAVGLRMVADR